MIGHLESTQPDGLCREDKEKDPRNDHLRFSSSRIEFIFCHFSLK